MKFFNTSKENNSEPEPDLRFSYLGSGSYLDLKLAKRGRLHKPLTPTGNPWCAFNKKIGTGSGSLPELCLRLFFWCQIFCITLSLKWIWIGVKNSNPDKAKYYESLRIRIRDVGSFGAVSTPQFFWIFFLLPCINRTFGGKNHLNALNWNLT